MLTCALRLVSVPMLAVLLAIPALAHAAILDDEPTSQACEQDQKQAPATAPFAPAATDQNTPTLFSAVRPIPSIDSHTIPTAHIAICRADFTLTQSADAAAHLTIELSKPLPSGQPASQLVHRFLVTSAGLQLEVDAPKGTSPRIHLALPLGTSTELALVGGNLEVIHLLGNSQIAIVKGNASLHVADVDFATLECATILGGIRDRRPNGSGNHGHMLATWTAHGTGKAKVEFSAVSGDLILLPPIS